MIIPCKCAFRKCAYESKSPDNHSLAQPSAA